MKIIGSKLRAARKAAGVTGEGLAGIADLTARRIFQIETDDVSNLNENAVNAICEFLDIKKEDLAEVKGVANADIK